MKDEMPEVELGFSDEDLAALFEGVEADEDVAEDPGAGEPPAEPVSKRGEVYDLGLSSVCPHCDHRNVQ